MSLPVVSPLLAWKNLPTEKNREGGGGGGVWEEICKKVGYRLSSVPGWWYECVNLRSIESPQQNCVSRQLIFRNMIPVSAF